MSRKKYIPISTDCKGSTENRRDDSDEEERPRTSFHGAAPAPSPPFPFARFFFFVRGKSLRQERFITSSDLATSLSGPFSFASCFPAKKILTAPSMARTAAAPC